MLSLKYLNEIKGNKNEYIFSLNEMIDPLYDGVLFLHPKFKEVYGSLCGGLNEGLLIEESLEALFNISNIDIKVIDYNKNRIILCQDEVKYIADIVIGKEGCSEPSHHINFNTLKVYDSEEYSISKEQNRKMNIIYTDNIYNKDENKLELSYTIINDIHSIPEIVEGKLYAPMMVEDLISFIERCKYIQVPIIEIESCFVNKKYRNKGLFTQAINEIISNEKDSIILTSAYIDNREYENEPDNYDPILIPLSEMLQRKFNLQNINKYVGQEYSIVLALGTGYKSKKIIDDILEKINKI